MVFSSTFFLIYFLPLFLVTYQLVGRRYKNVAVLAASLFFYSWGAPKFVFLLLASTIADFYIVKSIFHATTKKTKRLFLFTSLGLNLGMLAYFKYANFFIENFNSVLSNLGFSGVGWTEVVLPIGISFYTFQTITYSVDIYRKDHVPLQKLTDYLLYIFSFPQMIAGPIVRYSSVAKQIEHRKDTVDDRLLGFYRFCIGLAKKVLIANVMARQVDLTFGTHDYTTLSASYAWLGLLAYTFQIYFDFSGYSDMAIGLGRMIGFRFPENFNAPYISQNISEFWRRWHITLGDFMRDYLYIPLGGNRVSSNGRLYVNLITVFLLSGLWHGASWNFVLWGAYHGIFLILDRIFLKTFLSKLGKHLSIFITFVLVMMGWVIFKIEDTSAIFDFYSALFSPNWEFHFYELSNPFVIIGSVALFFSFITVTKWGSSAMKFVFYNENYSSLQHIVFAGFSLVLFVLSVSSIVSSEFNPFIYFRF